MSILFTTSISLTDNLYPDAKKQIPKRKNTDYKFKSNNVLTDDLITFF